MAVRIIQKHSKRNKLKKSSKSEIELTLPASKSEPLSDLQDYSILIFGKKKIGKTTLAAQFDEALFLMCEPGGRALSIRQVQVRDWKEFRGYVELAIKDNATRTIVIDTTDFAYEFCMAYVCEQMVIDHPSDETYGKGWNAVRKEFTKVVNMLLHSGKGVVFISHSKDEEFKTRKNESLSKVVSSMPGQAKDVLEGLVDIWVNYDYDGKRRVLVIGGNDGIDAGHRIEGKFKYPSGEPMETIAMGRSPKEGYKNFVDAFNNHAPVEKKGNASKKLVLKKANRLSIKRRST